jgi:hypothetical protein
MTTLGNIGRHLKKFERDMFVVKKQQRNVDGYLEEVESTAMFKGVLIDTETRTPRLEGVDIGGRQNLFVRTDQTILPEMNDIVQVDGERWQITNVRDYNAIAKVQIFDVVKC